MAKMDKDARVKLQQNKKLRRRWMTWLRMMRYGANNFTRNAWLTTAATAVMAVTLLIVFTTVTARSVLASTVDELRQKIDISIYLKSDVTPNKVTALRQKVTADSNVRSVRFITSDDARKDYVATNVKSNDVDQLRTLSELDANTFPAELRVAVVNPDKLDSLQKLVNQDEFKDELHPDLPPTFAGERRQVIATINGWAHTAERVGIVASLIFIAISILIIFNTIRMAIFNRRDEIEMMKLIGAERNFIRGPFVVEAVMYGFFAALVATALGYLMLVSAEPKLAEYGIAVGATKDLMVMLAPLVLVCMIIIGALIGSISARLAVRRYLKV